MTRTDTTPTLEREVSLHGDGATCAELLDGELARLDGKPARLVVDVDDVPTVDSQLLGALVLALKRLQRHGGRLELVSERRDVHRLLVRTGLQRVLTLRRQ